MHVRKFTVYLEIAFIYINHIIWSIINKQFYITAYVIVNLFITLPDNRFYRAIQVVYALNFLFGYATPSCKQHAQWRFAYSSMLRSVDVILR
jgi:hypothetical protein